MKLEDRGVLLVRYAFTEQLVDQAVRARALAWLLPEERERHQRFRFDRDRDAFLLAHALTNHTLSELSGRAPSELRFEHGEHGRPELVRAPSEPRLRFNLTHTDGLVACGFALDHDLGVDVEHVDRNVEIAALSARVFSLPERAALAAEPSDVAQRARFFRLWTLKEAYIKAIGKGLAAPLAAITFELGRAPGAAPRVWFGPEVEDDATRFSLGVREIGPRHVLAWAYGCAVPAKVTVEAYRLT